MKTGKTTQSQWIGWLPLVALPASALGLRNSLPPWGFMWLLVFSIYAALKWLTWWRARTGISHSGWRSAAYLFVWPGMDAETFLDSRKHLGPVPSRTWFSATFETGLGAVCL